MKHQSSTFQLNNSFFSWLRFSVKEQMNRWQLLASALSRQMITYIYMTESLTAKWFYINVISLILIKLDCSQNTGTLCRWSAEDLESFTIWQVLMGLSAAPNHQTHLRARYGKSLIFFFLFLLSKIRDWSTWVNVTSKKKKTSYFLLEQLVPHPPTLGFAQGGNPKWCANWERTLGFTQHSHRLNTSAASSTRVIDSPGLSAHRQW